MPEGVASTGSELALSASGPATEDVAGYEALTWTPWEEATEIGDIGPEGSEQTYTPVKDGNVVKISTSVNNGQVDAKGPYVKNDPAIMIIREATNSRPISPVWCRVTDSSGEIEYFKGNPNMAKKSIGTAESILMINATISVSGGIIRD